MKTFLLALCFIAAMGQTKAQSPFKPPLSHTDSLQYAKIKTINHKLKTAKGGFLVAGAAILGGGVLQYVRSNAKIPNPANYKTQYDYENAVNVYEGQQKQNAKFSSALFAIGGLTLVVVAFNF